MTYYVRYNLEFDPYQKVSNAPIYESKDVKEVKYRLDNLIIRNGFGLVMGAPGCGKTTAVRIWKESLNQQANKVVYITLSTVSVADFFRQLAFMLGNDPAYRKVDNFNLIRNSIRNYVIEQRKKVIIIVDEAHQLRSQTISDLKMLFNFDMDSKYLVTVILIGHQNIVQLLSTISNEAMKQRISMNYTVSQYSHEETIDYVQFKLKSAGCKVEVFTPNALDKIYSLSNGTPRIIDSICTTALQIGNNSNAEFINSDVIDSAYEEIAISI